MFNMSGSRGGLVRARTLEIDGGRAWFPQTVCVRDALGVECLSDACLAGNMVHRRCDKLSRKP